ncbi:MAG: hypothetical protein GY797_16325 [Deltaproteobacteria bacterium]|nr:hypothetical protein [Deltaproteobacteria bacterium]
MQTQNIITDNGSQVNVGWIFWIQWILANGIPVFVVWAISLVVSINFILGMCILFGIFLGSLQWFILHRHVFWVTYHWILVTSISWIVGFFVAIALSLMLAGLDPTGNWSKLDVVKLTSIFGGLIGISIGLAQWFILSKHSYQTYWWVLVNSIGWAVGFGLGGYWLSSFDSFVVAGTIAGIITGGPLIWLLRHQLTFT